MKSNSTKDGAFVASRTYELINSLIAYGLPQTRLSPWCSGYLSLLDASFKKVTNQALPKFETWSQRVRGLHWWEPLTMVLAGSNSADNYMFKVNNRSNRKRCKICSKLIMKTSEWCHCRCSGVFINNFEQISQLVLVFSLLILSR